MRKIADFDDCLLWLATCAAAGEPAPTNAAICRRYGLTSTASATRIITVLERRGLIRVTRFNRAREIEIVATGQKTAVVTDERTPHVARGSKNNPREPSGTAREAPGTFEGSVAAKSGADSATGGGSLHSGDWPADLAQSASDNEAAPDTAVEDESDRADPPARQSAPPDGCRFPMWGKGPATGEFCGKERTAREVRGEMVRASYCAEHYALCYVKPKEPVALEEALTPRKRRAG